MNGRLMTRMRTARGQPKTFDSNIEMPVTPPSMKWLDIKKPFRPKPAENMPMTIRIELRASRISLCIELPPETLKPGHRLHGLNRYHRLYAVWYFSFDLALNANALLDTTGFMPCGASTLT